MAGRPRVATNILDARGAFKVNPARKRPNEPEGKGGFPKRPPAHLEPDVRACWREIVRVVPKGVLTGSDVFHVEIVATLLAEFRAAPLMMHAARLARLSVEMNRIGLNPSGRASLAVNKPEAGNEFDDV